jgi:hypothetical protein
LQLTESTANAALKAPSLVAASRLAFLDGRLEDAAAIAKSLENAPSLDEVYDAVTSTRLKAGVSLATLWRLEARRPATLQIGRKLADDLGVTPPDLQRLPPTD